MQLTDFRALGRSGLIVSPLALGTMTFGVQRWGATDAGAEAIFNAYTDAGGNFVDTADVYSGGRSEELVGEFIAKRGLRDKIVLATKCGFNSDKGNPHGGGNGRKHIYTALDASLRRLKTDCIDLYWMHVWDMVTPAEEVLHTMGDLVRAGKIRYFGYSDLPAWYAAKAATLAAAHHIPGPVALQMEYSLVARGIEQEHIPAALDAGLGITPWSPLAAGFLAGKYERRKEGGATGEGRLTGANPFGDSKFTDDNWRVLDVLRSVAKGMSKPLAQVALAWVAAQPGVSSAIIGASRPEQLQDSIASLEITFSPAQLQALSGSSNTPLFFTPGLRKMIFGGADVQAWRP